MIASNLYTAGLTKSNCSEDFENMTWMFGNETFKMSNNLSDLAEKTEDFNRLQEYLKYIIKNKSEFSQLSNNSEIIQSIFKNKNGTIISCKFISKIVLSVTAGSQMLLKYDTDNSTQETDKLKEIKNNNRQNSSTPEGYFNVTERSWENSTETSEVDTSVVVINATEDWNKDESNLTDEYRPVTSHISIGGLNPNDSWEDNSVIVVENTLDEEFLEKALEFLNIDEDGLRFNNLQANPWRRIMRNYMRKIKRRLSGYMGVQKRPLRLYQKNKLRLFNLKGKFFTLGRFFWR